MQNRQSDVLRSEVMAPLRYAVRFIDGKQGNGYAIQHFKATLSQQTLRRDIQEIQLTLAQCTLHAHGFVKALTGIQKRGANAEFAQCIDLILHEGDEWRNNDAASMTQQRRDLITQRLAAASRHKHKRIATTRDQLNNLCLRSAKGRITKHTLQ